MVKHVFLVNGLCLETKQMWLKYLISRQFLDFILIIQNDDMSFVFHRPYIKLSIKPYVITHQFLPCADPESFVRVV